MNFNERKSPTTTVKAISTLVPRIGISPDALTKMHIYVDSCSDEIGWLGTAIRDEKNNTIIIDDVFLFDQDVHGTTTEITPEGLMSFAEDLLLRPDGMDVWNNLKMWGHSHVNMGVSPSGQDDSQMVTFNEGGHDWFLRLIANKKGDLKIDLYDYKNGITFLDLPWVEMASDDEMKIQEEIEKLYAMLDAFQSERANQYKKNIEEEMKLKVRKMRTIGYGQQANQKKTHGNSNVTSMTTSTKMSGGTDVTKKKENDARKKDEWDMETDLIGTAEDIKAYFTASDLIELSYCQTLQEFVNDIEEFGYEDFFTMNDMMMIWEYVDEEFGIRKGGYM